MGVVSLEDFVAESLSAISVGVRRAQNESMQKDGIPIALSAVGEETVKLGEQLVRFSVSVEAGNETQAAGAGDVKLPVISVVTGSVGGEVSHSKAGKSLHVIEFSVPVHFNAIWPTDL